MTPGPARCRRAPRSWLRWLAGLRLGGSTALTVDQGPFVTEGRRALHEDGWTDSLDRLEELITSRDWFGRD
jgi:hypothetical protein